MSNSQESEDKKEIKSRRSLLSAFAGGFVASAILTSKKASADAVGGDTAAITSLWIWLKAEYAIIMPYIKSIKEHYDLAKGFVVEYNKFVKDFNESMQWLYDVRKLMTDPQENIFYQQYKQLSDYYNDIMKQKNNDLLSFRLKHLHPVMIRKIDSMAADIENIYDRAVRIAKKNGFSESKLKNDGEEQSNTNRSDMTEKIKGLFTSDDEIEKKIRTTKRGKIAIRLSNDNAKYFQASANLQAIRSSIEEIKKNYLPDFKLFNKSSKSQMELYNEMLFPKLIDAVLLQTSVNIETYQKFNDLLVMFTNQAPIVSANEKMVTRDDLKNLANSFLVTGNPEVLQAKDLQNIKSYLS